jgi:DNA transformation protein and related proteins
MPVSADFLQYVLEQLARAGRLSSRRMFGGAGIYCDDVFFAVIDDDTLYFKVGDSTRSDYESRGMHPFRPYKDKPEVSMSYYTVPADILDDAEELVAWARRSVKVAANSPRPARRATSAKTPRKPAKSATAKTARGRAPARKPRKSPQKK